MPNRLKDKTALVTGATSGIGRATARILAESGTHLLLTGRRNKRLEQFEGELENEFGIRVQTYAFDIRNREACKNFTDSLDEPVDILVNNAGLASGVGKIHDADMDDWEVMIDTNIKGLLYITRFVSEAMKERGSGHIINVGSVAGHETYSGGVVYSATKHAVRAITEAAKKDLHGTGVRVSAVSPGMVETEFSKVRFQWDEERADKVYEGYQPLTAEDVAELIHFIANRPAHVNIMDSIIFPTAQSAATMVYRDTES